MTRRKLIQAIAVAPALVRAQTLEDKGHKLIDATLEALGGQKFLTMKDRTETGRAYSFYRERLNGLDLAKFETMYDDNATGDVKQRERQTFGKKQDYYLLFEGNGKAWDVTYRGPKPLPEEMVQQWQESVKRNAMYILRCRTKEKGIIFESRGLEVFDNQPVEIVDVIDADNRTTSLYLHQTTKLPVRAFSKRQNQKDRGWDEFDTRYGKYRSIGGLMWPWSITRSRNGERNLELYSDDVKIDSGLSRANFEFTAKVKEPR